jgi:hypothetical protein
LTTDYVLVLAWLVLAHLVADFLLQTDRIVEDKFASGRRAWRGLLVHGAAVGLCLVPVAAAYAERGVVLLAIVAVGHVVIDRWKVRATRHAQARALVDARRRHATSDEDVLGAAWTPVPAALFVVDQFAHLGLIGLAWAALLAPVAPTSAWTSFVAGLTAAFDLVELHRWILVSVVAATLLIVNVRAGALLVATLVQSPGRHHADTEPSRTPGEPPVQLPHGWRVRIGPIVANAEPRLAATVPAWAADARAGAAHPASPATSSEGAPPRAASPSAAPGSRAHGHPSPARIGATIGVLERLLIVTFVLTGSTAAIGFVVAAKTLARFKQLDDRDFAEYYLLGTLASVGVALGSALLAAAALATLPA